jgi:hypothetical protein
MTKTDQPKPTPNPLLLVYGKPTSPELPQASWFRIEERQAVVAAAQSLKFSVLDIQTDGERSLLIGVHEGALKGSGRMIIGSVAPEVYKRIEEYAAKATGALAVQAPSEVAERPNPTREQNINRGVVEVVSGSDAKTGVISPPSSPRDTLRVGARVLAAYWNEKNEFDGFWLATVKRIESGEFTLEWVAAPKFPPFTAPPKNIAVPHPEFRPSGK